MNGEKNNLPRRGVSTLSTRSTLPVFTREWPPSVSVRGHVVLVHGYAEHSGRYERLAIALNAAGLHVNAFDHRGHGQSPGKRGYISNFAILVDDLANFVAQVRQSAAGKPVFLFAHSMGGLLAVHYLAMADHALLGAVISSPLLAIPDHVSPRLLAVSRFLSVVTPWLPVEKLDPGAISRDESEVRAYCEDPLVYHGPIRARTGAELARAIQIAETLPPDIALPLLVIHGTADRLAPPIGSRRLFECAASTDKSSLFVEGGYHELLNDLDRDATLDAVMNWLCERLP